MNIFYSSNPQFFERRLLVLRVPYIPNEIKNFLSSNRLALAVRRASEVDGDAFPSRHAMDFWIQILARLLGGFGFRCTDRFGHRASQCCVLVYSGAGAAYGCLKLSTTDPSSQSCVWGYMKRPSECGKAVLGARVSKLAFC